MQAQTHLPPAGHSLRRFGATAVLVDCLSLEAALHAHGHLAAHPAPGVTELVPAARTLLVRFAAPEYADAFMAAPSLPEASGDVRAHGATVEIEVVYDGQDLAEVASLLGMSEQAVVHLHTTGRWSVAFAGFAPGFFYLHRHGNLLDVPRRSTPRTAVPAGAVGLAGDFSGIYPRTSPGGWQLIGRTDAPLWDLSRETPALLEPGMQVQFRAVREQVEVASVPSPALEAGGEPLLRVDSPGIQTLFQDAGRSGLTHWGVSPSGAADAAAAAEANRLVGNPAGATVLEHLAGGLSLTALEDTVLALTGARVEATLSPAPDAGGSEGALVEGSDSQPLAALPYRPFALKAGQKLTLAPATEGLRVYVALRGGFAAPVLAQSSSRDTLAALGPEPLAAGDLLYSAQLPAPVVADPAPALPLPQAEGQTPIRVLLGPRDDWFTPQALEAFTSLTWEVTQASDRIGVRLAPVQEVQLAEGAEQPGPVLARSISGELPSEGMVAGAIQVPPSGEPVVFLADHPVTGGYPVIATVHPADLRLLAQAPPSTRLRFCPVSAQSLTAPSTDFLGAEPASRNENPHA